MKAEQLNEFNKEDWEENESVNLHSENALELAKEFGTPEEVEAMQRIMDQHMRRGHILPHEIEERSALTSKYYSMLEHSVNPTLKSTLEGYKVMPPMDPKYVARSGLEGPFTTLSGKVVYYDPKEGKYYDPDTDIYLSYDEFQQYDNDYSGIGDEEADDFVKDIEPKETVKGPRGHLGSIVADDLNEIDCWDGYKKDGTKAGTGKNAGKRVNNCVKEGARGLGSIDWPEEEMMQTATDVIRHGYSKNDSFSHLYSMYGDDHGKWLRANEDMILDVFSQYMDESISEAGGFYTKPIYDMIKQHGYPKVMHELLTSLHADVIQDFISRADLNEGPFNGVGKMMMKRKLNKQYKKSDLANFDDAGIDTSGKTPDEIGQMKSDYYHDNMDKAARAKKAGNRLGKNVKYGIVRYPDTAISYIKNDGSGWMHMYDKSYGFSGPVDKEDMKHAKKIDINKIPSRMFDSVEEGKYVSDAQRKAVHASKAEKK